MTEDEWMRSDTVSRLVAVQKLGPRKMRLLAVAACRALGDASAHPSATAALAAAEAYADTGKSKAALRRARQAVETTRSDLYRPDEAQVDLGVELALFAVQAAVEEKIVTSAIGCAAMSLLAATGAAGEAVERSQYRLFADIRTPLTQSSRAFVPWRSSAAITLAGQMYESRDFAAMPILADAIQDAGCEDERVLAHCRGPGPHVRGCWVVDGVLGKD